MFDIRDTAPGDIAAIRAIHDAAFGQTAEGELAAALIASGAPVVSLGAWGPGGMAGHILFSPVTLPGAGPPVSGLGPMAVAPGMQRRGAGSALVHAGLARLRADGHGAAVVLGHPEYYPRFGFMPAAHFGVVCKYPAPPEAFMAIELVPGALDGRAGEAAYHPLFDNV